MKYMNARDILPESLICQIQRYIQGGMLYIPNQAEQRAGWGSKSGSSAQLQRRNRQIHAMYQAGEDIHTLAQTFFLSTDSVRKIIQKERQRERAAC